MGRPFDNPRDSYGMSVSDIDQEVARLRSERAMLIQRGTQKQMDPKDEQLINLAHEAGEMKALYAGQKERADKQLETIKTLREKNEVLREIEANRDHWKDRATVAETRIYRSEIARKAARKRKK